MSLEEVQEMLKKVQNNNKTVILTKEEKQMLLKEKSEVQKQQIKNAQEKCFRI